MAGFPAGGSCSFCTFLCAHRTNNCFFICCLISKIFITWVRIKSACFPDIKLFFLSSTKEWCCDVYWAMALSYGTHSLSSKILKGDQALILLVSKGAQSIQVTKVTHRWIGYHFPWSRWGCRAFSQAHTSLFVSVLHQKEWLMTPVVHSK